MCGIAGYFGAHLPTEDRLHAGSKALSHRGPDGEGLYLKRAGDSSIALIHRRLAIIDLDPRSNQPFQFDSSVLIFNGEIYNYLELRQELQSLGHQFLTKGDTEVLAHALRQWGEAAQDKLEGMWAFAWYDERNGRLLLSRDRFGEKPLYIWRRDGGMYFASEVKGLVALVGEVPAVNQEHLIRYMVNGYKALYKGDDTFFCEIEELSSGTCLFLSQENQGRLKTYWRPSCSEDESLTYSDAVAATREALINAVRLRLRSDVPLAFCMSGGVDSNTLLATARRILDCDVHGFTITNTDERYEEQALVDQAVQDLNIRHMAVKLEKGNFLKQLQALIIAHDSPISTISYYVHSQLMQRMASEGYKVTISGTGADELFTGYYDHHNLYLYEVANNSDLHERSLAAWQQHQSGVVRNPHLQDPDLYLKNPDFRDHIYLKNDMFSSWLHRSWSEPFTETQYDSGLLRNRMLNELFAEVVPVILHEDDLNAMSFSIENRSPFLDRKLFELAYSIPVRHMMREGSAKAVLRDAMRGIVPDPILDNRRKVGFNAPILDLVDIRDAETRAVLLDDGPVYTVIRKDKIEALLKQDQLPNSASKFLFSFINVKLFMEYQEALL